MLSSDLLHDRLGHPNLDVGKHVAINMNKELTPTSNSNLYSLCQLAKARRLSITYVHSRFMHHFDIIHVDL